MGCRRISTSDADHFLAVTKSGTLNQRGTGRCASGRAGRVQYQSDYILRIVEQMGAALREAFARFSTGAEPEEPLALTEAAIGLVVDMDPKLFLRFSPQSMVSFVTMSGLDDRVVAKLVEALELEADILDTEGNIVEARVRREQAHALAGSTAPSSAN